jgi:hypothetical protein
MEKFAFGNVATFFFFFFSPRERRKMGVKDKRTTTLRRIEQLQEKKRNVSCVRFLFPWSGFLA